MIYRGIPWSRPWWNEGRGSGRAGWYHLHIFAYFLSLGQYGVFGFVKTMEKVRKILWQKSGKFHSYVFLVEPGLVWIQW